MDDNIAIDIQDDCGGLLPFVKILRNYVLRVIWIFIPILLIVLGTVDLGKAVISGDEKKTKEAQGSLIRRLVYAALVFFVVFIVQFILNLIAQVGATGTNSWAACWDAAGSN